MSKFLIATAAALMATSTFVMADDRPTTINVPTGYKVAGPTFKKDTNVSTMPINQVAAEFTNPLRSGAGPDSDK